MDFSTGNHNQKRMMVYLCINKDANYLFMHRYWHLCESLSHLEDWLSDEDKSLVQCESHKNDMCVDITVLCGDLKCKFRLKTFKYETSSWTENLN